jgi:hypothetical protein
MGRYLRHFLCSSRKQKNLINATQDEACHFIIQLQFTVSIKQTLPREADPPLTLLKRLPSLHNPISQLMNKISLLMLIRRHPALFLQQEKKNY